MRPRERLRDMPQEPRELGVVAVRERVVDIAFAEGPQQQARGPDLDLPAQGQSPFSSGRFAARQPRMPPSIDATFV
jgi:hypothetical protein